MKKKFEKINVDEKTNEYIRYVAKALNKPISTLLSELFSEIIATCLQFQDGCNVSYLRERDDVRSRFSGCPRIKVGSFKVGSEVSDSECDRLIAEELAKAEKVNKENFGENNP